MSSVRSFIGEDGFFFLVSVWRSGHGGIYITAVGIMKDSICHRPILKHLFVCSVERVTLTSRKAAVFI